MATRKVCLEVDSPMPPTTAIDTITTWRHAPQEHATKLWKNQKTAGLWGDKVASALSRLLLLLAATSYQLSYGSDSLSHRKGMRAGSAVTWLETITAWQSLIFFGICKFWFLGIFRNHFFDINTSNTQWLPNMVKIPTQLIWRASIRNTSLIRWEPLHQTILHLNCISHGQSWNWFVG